MEALLLACRSILLAISSDKTITAWIPLQKIDPEMGPLEFSAGSQVVRKAEPWPLVTKVKNKSKID